MFKHAEDGVKQLAHDSDQGDHFGFAASQQMVIEGAQVRLVAALETVYPRVPHQRCWVHKRVATRYAFYAFLCGLSAGDP